MRTEFIHSIKIHQPDFGFDLPETKIEILADFYDLILEHNEILHLVGPMAAEEFAIRHVLESLMILEYLPEGATFADIGPGGGFPSIPCLIVRDDLSGILIESKPKKANFLNEVIAKFDLNDRAEIVANQFEECEYSAVGFVTCRALDKFTKKLPKLIKWSQGATKLLFGGNSLAEALGNAGIKFEQRLLPMSEQRFLFHVK